MKIVVSSFAIMIVSGLLVPARAAYVIEKDGFRLAIRVIPRLGGFNNSLYQEARDKQCKQNAAPTLGEWTWEKYRAALARNYNSTPIGPELDGDRHIRAAFPAGFPEWDIVTTSTTAKEHACAYGGRRVLVAVAPIDALDLANCTFKVNGKATGATAGICKLDMILRSNSEVPLEVTVATTSGGTPIVINAFVPEDVLIVSLGDSYASGEGNPDIPRQDDEKAYWMDEWCHRSIHAGPLRAGIRILQGGSKLDNVRYKRATEAGAMTLISFACSGGWISNGIDGPYEGVKPLEKFERRNRMIDLVNDHKPKQLALQKIPPQITQLKEFFKTQLIDSEPNKTSIDLLVIGGGGNDVLFAPLIQAMVLGDLENDKINDSLAKQIDASFIGLDQAYEKFAPNLKANKLIINSQEIAVLNVIPVLYPDLMKSSPEFDCTGALEQKSTNILGMGINILMSLFEKGISPAEVGFVREKVLHRLNNVIVRFSDRYGWHPLDPTPTGSFLVDTNKGPDADARLHGWCQEAAKSPYSEQQRWFRQPSDSLKFQNNINGSFHPTWQFNETVTASMIAKVFRQSVNAEPNWDAIRPQKEKKMGKTIFLSAKAQFSYATLGVDAPRPELSIGNSTEIKCIVTEAGCQGNQSDFNLGIHGNEVDVFASALHQSFRRKYPQRQIGHYKIDQLPPTIRFENRPELLVDSTTWLAERQIFVSAKDLDSGVAFLDIKFTDEQYAGAPQSIMRASEHSVDAMVQFPTDGQFNLKICSHDWVGNASAECDRLFSIKVDTTPLRTKSIAAYGVQWWSDLDGREEPTIPYFPGIEKNSSISFVPNDASGLAKSRDCSTPENDTCALALESSKMSWQLKRHGKAYNDGAGNATSIVYWTITTIPFNPARKERTVASWPSPSNREEFTNALRAALLVSPKISQLFSQTEQAKIDLKNLLSQQTPDDKSAAVRLFAGASDKQLIAKWLNILSGRLFAFNADAAQLQPECSGGVVGGNSTNTVFQHLYAKTSCLQDSRNAIVSR